MAISLVSTLPSGTDVQEIGANASGGMRLGASSSELIAFYGATAADQPSGASQTALAASQTTKTTTQLRSELTAAKTLLSKIRTDLIALGLIKGSA